MGDSTGATLQTSIQRIAESRRNFADENYRYIEKEVVPPLSRDQMYKKMIMERYGVLGSLKIMGKAALGKKI